MESFVAFEHDLHEMLTHLYDPAYRPPESFWKMLNIERESDLPALRNAILAGIQSLKPHAQTPATARSWRIYGMLHYRYAEGFSQEVTAEKLGITARHLRRDFSEAIHALGMALWETHAGALPQAAAGSDASARTPPAAATQPGDEADVSWHEQLVRELEALEGTAAGVIASVAETLTSVLRLAGQLAKGHDISLQADAVSPQLMAAVHPSALRHILLSVIDQLIKQMQRGEIRLSATASAGEVHICLAAKPLPTAAGNDFEAFGELLSSFNIRTNISPAQDTLQISFALVQVDRCVLVIDDNADMAHLYRRYLAGTRYYLHHIPLGEQALTTIELHHPDVIVLDVMLPDIDGWDLLTRLHEDPYTRCLPVLICSVMREKELAHSLGARYFLTKPVQRQEFIQALDGALQQA